MVCGKSAEPSLSDNCLLDEDNYRALDVVIYTDAYIWREVSAIVS